MPLQWQEVRMKPVIVLPADHHPLNRHPPPSPELYVVVPVAPDGSRPPPVVGGVANPKETESPPTTITTPELDLPPARTSRLPSTSTAPPDETVPSSQVSNLDMFKDDDLDLEDLMVADCSHSTQEMRKHIISPFSDSQTCSLLLSSPPRKLPC